LETGTQAVQSQSNAPHFGLAITAFSLSLGVIGEPKVIVLILAILLVIILLWLGYKDGAA
jgi:hypothetical protein